MIHASGMTSHFSGIGGDSGLALPMIIAAIRALLAVFKRESGGDSRMTDSDSTVTAARFGVVIRS